MALLRACTTTISNFPVRTMHHPDGERVDEHPRDRLHGLEHRAELVVAVLVGDAVPFQRSSEVQTKESTSFGSIPTSL